MHLIQLRILLRDEIAKEIATISERLAGGRAADYVEYRHQVGRIQGNADAIDAVERVFNKFFNDEGE